MNRREITERTHRDRIGATKIGTQLGSEVLERVKAMAGVETFLVFAVAALDLTVVARCIGPDQLMPDTQVDGSGLEKGRKSSL